MKKHIQLISAGLLFVTQLCVQPAKSQDKTLPLIPYPAQVSSDVGVFSITRATAINIPVDGSFANEAHFLNDFIRKGLGKNLIISKKSSSHGINLVYSGALTVPEAYRLTITSRQILIEAKDAAGMFHAMETIRQLLPVSVERGIVSKKLNLPALTITDAPSYSWRGMHLDVSRHFFSVSYLKKFIDVLALYKMNKLHLHLTDDQGWRIEIKKYPKLTSEGAWRTFNNQDSACIARAKENPDFEIDKQHIYQRNGKTVYGGFYTQQQMKEVVAYATQRHIDIIPEIDMPGHMMAAINSYPFLTCNGENKWGADFTKPICPCNEATFEFAENVFSEIMDIFPSTYIHIGGDEVDRSDWGKSEACKALMQKEGIKDLPALQSYFINRMEKFFNSKGRKLIGWDEILEGGISPTAIVMYWRTWVPDAPYKAAKNGNTVIMTPGSPLYFDYPADNKAINNVYHFNPMPAGLTATEAKAIIGAQANIWTEYIPSEKRADYMYMPRMTALAEMLWTNKTAYYTDYLNRLTDQYARMDALNIHYRLPDLDKLVENNVFTDKAVLSLQSPLKGYSIHYTTNGTLPLSTSPLLANNMVIDHSVQIALALFAPNGRRGDLYHINYQKQQLADTVNINNTKAGLVANYYKAFFKEVSAIAAAKSDSSFSIGNITVPKSIKAPAFALKYNGYIHIPKDGIYSFYLTSDDGSVLHIANKLIV
ncbi:MAG TPA: family 20 glycosylhydrolase, partial [Mucilaginibacter sp.]|nr:family 20 glycosylhydrolase [Mucilaginibacter sp.]